MFEAKERSAEILGKRFRIVENGLDEGEVSALIEGLTSWNSGLARELEHLQASLAEERWAYSARATDTGGDDAARAEAERIVAEARREAGDLVAEARRKVEAAERQADEILHEAATQVEPAKTVAEEEGRQIIEQTVRTAELEAQRIREEAQLTALPNGQLQEEPLSESVDTRYVQIYSDISPAAAKTAVKGAGVPEAAGEDRALYEGTVDLAIRPPIVLDRVVKLHRHLKKTPQVKVMDVKRSDDRGLRMRLHLPKRTPLLDVLKSFPEVKHIAIPRQEAILGAPSRQAGDRKLVRKVFVTTRR